MCCLPLYVTLAWCVLHASMRPSPWSLRAGASLSSLLYRHVYGLTLHRPSHRSLRIPLQSLIQACVLSASTRTLTSEPAHPSPASYTGMCTVCLYMGPALGACASLSSLLYRLVYCLPLCGPSPLSLRIPLQLRVNIYCIVLYCIVPYCIGLYIWYN